MRLRRFWFEFAPGSDVPAGLRLGCGVTAFDLDDARRMIRERVFRGDAPPAVKIVEDVDVSSLDPGHVLPNMFAPNTRGVWFPLGLGVTVASTTSSLLATGGAASRRRSSIRSGSKPPTAPVASTRSPDSTA